MIYIGNDWEKILNEEYKKDYFKKIISFINNEYKTKTIYPPYKEIFNAFKLTSFKNTKVIILGQDPYQKPNQAMGLAFSVNKDIKIPPSLLNIYKELKEDLNIINNTGDLTSWAKEGVLLLNTTLTVIKGKGNSHANIGWNIFTDNVIKLLNDKKEHLVFILWGNNAISKEKLIDPNKHLILKSSHPSPLSAYKGFFGSKPFSKTNNYLKKHNINKINWKL